MSFTCPLASAFFIVAFRLSLGGLASNDEDLFRGEAQDTYFWGDWSKWSECERHCSSSQGVRRRVRVCFRSANTQHLIQLPSICNGRLAGEHSDEESCYDAKCDGTGSFVGSWSPWEPWMCTYHSGVCGEGTRVRHRFCSMVSGSVALDSNMRVGPENCPEGSDTEEEECFARCPPNSRADKYGGWSDWSHWLCNTKCAPGIKATRSRECNNPPPLQGYTCPGVAHQEVPCNGTCVKQWGEWLHWSQCSKTCDQALRERHRDCVGHGQPCVGESVERTRCLDQTRHQLCPPVDGGWSRWSFWTDDCSVTCGRGVRTRKRQCNNPPKAGLGEDCEGRANETRVCTVDAVCPIDGKWSAWSTVEDCSKECGGGIGHSSRRCTPPQNGGKPCEGESERADMPCNTDPCPDATLPPELANTIQQQLDASHANFVKEPGDAVQMDCTGPIAVLHAEYPDGKIEWERNGHHLAIDGARIQLDTGKLIFEAVKSADNGVYSCQAEAGGVSKISLALFSLAVPPEAPDIQAYEAESLEIPCNGEQLGLVFDGFTTQWYKGDSLIKSYEDVEPEEVNVEHFKNIDKRYEGVYKCVVTHDASQRTWVTNIAQVEVLPKRAMHKRLMAMAMSKENKNTTMMVIGGVGGFLVLVLLGCCACFFCCLGDEDDDEKDTDKEASKPLIDGKEKMREKQGSKPSKGSNQRGPRSGPSGGSDAARPPPRAGTSLKPRGPSGRRPPQATGGVKGANVAGAKRPRPPKV